MIGAIIGDLVGSVFEWNNIKSKDFPFLTDDNFITDDTIFTIGIGKALVECKDNWEKLPEVTTRILQELGRKYPDAGYGNHQMQWILSHHPNPYNSLGNGAGMRVSAVAYVGKTIEEVMQLSDLVTGITHNHPEGLKAARAIAVLTFMAYNKTSKAVMKQYVNKHFYKLNFTLDDIRATYTYDVTAPGSTPQAIQAFFESTSFEDAIRNAISIGGDSDTIAAMTGAIAEAHYGVSEAQVAQMITYLPSDLRQLLLDFYNTYR